MYVDHYFSFSSVPGEFFLLLYLVVRGIKLSAKRLFQVYLDKFRPETGILSTNCIALPNKHSHLIGGDILIPDCGCNAPKCTILFYFP